MQQGVLWLALSLSLSRARGSSARVRRTLFAGLVDRATYSRGPFSLFPKFLQGVWKLRETSRGTTRERVFQSTSSDCSQDARYRLSCFFSTLRFGLGGELVPNSRRVSIWPAFRKTRSIRTPSRESQSTPVMEPVSSPFWDSPYGRGKETRRSFSRDGVGLLRGRAAAQAAHSCLCGRALLQQLRRCGLLQQQLELLLLGTERLQSKRRLAQAHFYRQERLPIFFFEKSWPRFGHSWWFKETPQDTRATIE